MTTLDYEGSAPIKGCLAHLYYHARGDVYFAAFASGITTLHALDQYDFADGDTPGEALSRLAYH